MSLTIGRGPFGPRRAGRFDPAVPGHVVYVAPLGRRVRAHRGDDVVVDSERAVLVHETGKLPTYAFPPEDVHIDATEDPRAEGFVAVPWAAAERWFEEDEQIMGHPRDPFTRIDTFATSRLVVVTVAGEEVARSTRSRVLFETGLPPRYYLPPDDVRLDLLERSDTVTRCAYKGQATHWSARLGGERHEDVAWSYEGEVSADALAVRGMLSFYDDRAEVTVSGA